MQTVKKHATHVISGFEMSKIVLHNLKHFGLKPQTKTVIMILADCYNPENGAVVFPSMEYIATEGDMSLTSAKEGIKELINKGLIIKSKRGKVRGNYNKYLLTPKVQNPTSEQSENELFKRSESDCFMIGTKKKEKIKQQTKENVVAFSKTFLLKNVSVQLNDVPNIIKNNKNIKNPCAYWASLSDEVKQEYRTKDVKEIEKKQKQKIKLQHLREEQLKKQEEHRKLVEECSKPLEEQYTYETACSFIKKVANVEKSLAYRGIAKLLSETFNIEVDRLLMD